MSEENGLRVNPAYDSINILPIYTEYDSFVSLVTPNTITVMLLAYTSPHVVK